jgi:glutamate-1-semialdehyde 2,1-aminomutase
MEHNLGAGPHSRSLFQRAQKVIPGGVNSPVRAFRAVGGDPIFIAHAQGCHVTDVDGRTYIDYVGSWGPMLFGHAVARVADAVAAAAGKGTSFGAPTETEVELAEKIVQMVPSVEKVRLVSSGTEAAMSAVRLARGATGRDKVIKFEGCYHGHGDAFLIQAGSGAATFGVPSSPGVPAGTASDTLIARYNDLDSVGDLLQRHPKEIAALIVEPVAGNMGCIPPESGFLQGLRQLCDAHGAVLIFDEVITGFRLAPGGAQALFSVRPDLTVMGKILGGGLPLGAYGGRADLMDQIAPAGPVYQAGTLSGNPLATAAGLTMLRMIEDTPDLYSRLSVLTRRLSAGLIRIQEELGVSLTQNRTGSLFTLFFQPGEVKDWGTAKGSDTECFGRWFRGMLKRGVYLAPSQFECGFVSYAHTEFEIDATLEAARGALQEAFS